MSDEEDRVAEILERVKKDKGSNVRSLPTATPEQPKGGEIIGMTISPALQARIIKRLAKLPWEKVNNIMPELLAAQAIRREK